MSYGQGAFRMLPNSGAVECRILPLDDLRFAVLAVIMLLPQNHFLQSGLPC